MDIKAWINNPNRSYKDGLAIYHKVKRNKDKDTFLNQVSDAAPGSIYFNILLQEVKNAYRIILANNIIIDQTPPKPPPGKPITTARLVLGKNAKTPTDSKQLAKPVFVHNDLVDVKSLPVDLQSLYFRNQEITREVAGLHQQLKSATSDEARALIAGHLDSVFNERVANWKQLDAFSGVDSEEISSAKQSQSDAGQQKSDTVTASVSNKELAKQMLEAQKRLKTVKINISRVEKELTNKDLTTAKAKSRKARLKVWKSEQDDLESVLSGL